MAHQVHAGHAGRLPQQLCARHVEGRAAAAVGPPLSQHSDRCSAQAGQGRRQCVATPRGMGPGGRVLGWPVGGETRRRDLSAGGARPGAGAEAAGGHLPAAPGRTLALSSSSAGELSSSRTPGSEMVTQRMPASRRATAAAGVAPAAGPGGFGAAAAAAAAPAAEVEGCVGSKNGRRCEAPGSSRFRPAYIGSQAGGQARPCLQWLQGHWLRVRVWARAGARAVVFSHPGCCAAGKGCTTLLPGPRCP